MDLNLLKGKKKNNNNKVFCSLVNLFLIHDSELGSIMSKIISFMNRSPNSVNCFFRKKVLAIQTSHRKK